jgi:hypothetical protein
LTVQEAHRSRPEIQSSNVSLSSRVNAADGLLIGRRNRGAGSLGTLR